MIDIEKLRKAMKEIAAKRGEFTLFALFQREDTLAGWDLVVSATWLEPRSLKSLADFADALKNVIGERQLKELSRIVTINQDDPALLAILKSIQVEDNVVELRENVFFDLRVEHAIFLRAKRNSDREAQTTQSRIA